MVCQSVKNLLLYNTEYSWKIQSVMYQLVEKVSLVICEKSTRQRTMIRHSHVLDEWENMRKRSFNNLKFI